MSSVGEESLDENLENLTDKRGETMEKSSLQQPSYLDVTIEDNMWNSKIQDNGCAEVDLPAKR